MLVVTFRKKPLAHMLTNCATPRVLLTIKYNAVAISKLRFDSHILYFNSTLHSNYNCWYKIEYLLVPRSTVHV